MAARRSATAPHDNENHKGTIMNVDVEDLLRSGMERFTEEVPVPRGLAHRAARARRRRMAIRAAAGAGTAAITAAAVIAATGGPGAGGGAMQAHHRLCGQPGRKSAR